MVTKRTKYNLLSGKPISVLTMQSLLHEYGLHDELKQIEVILIKLHNAIAEDKNGPSIIPNQS